jgi:hypothetical protein
MGMNNGTDRRGIDLNRVTDRQGMNMANAINGCSQRPHAKEKTNYL